MKNKLSELTNECFLYLDSDFNNFFRMELLNILKERNIINEDVFDLENIDRYVIDKNLLEVDLTCGLNHISLQLYETNEKFMEIYLDFLKDLYYKLKFDFYFQEIPTIRVHCPNENCDIFFPKYHSDCFFGHPPQEINVWFSLTQNKHSGFYFLDNQKSTDWFSMCDFDVDVFLKRCQEDKSFVDIGNGLATEIDSTTDKIFLFDSYCIHTNQPRKDDCRTSIDIRINPVDSFVEGYEGKGRMKAEFKPGGRRGYHLKSIKEIIES